MMKDKKILLLSPPLNIKDSLGDIADLLTPSVPHGLLSIRAYLKSKNINCKFIDSYALNCCNEDIVDYICENNIKLVGISVLTGYTLLLDKLLKLIREKYQKTIICLGNIHASTFHEYYLNNNYADIVVHGDGEIPFYEIAECILNSKPYYKVKGISFKKDGKIIKTGKGGVVQDLDDIPIIDYLDTPYEKYKMPFYHIPENCKRDFTMITSRGCPVGCTFCTIFDNKKVRYNSVDRVIEEINYLIKNIGVDYIIFHDPLFIANKKRIKQICERIIHENIKITWSCEGHVNFIEEDLLIMMKTAGCYSIFFGIESGVQELLNRINKKSTLEKIEQAIKITNKTGIKSVGFFMLGLPGETREMSLETIKFSCNLPIKFAQFNICTPQPGSQLFNELVEEGKIDPYDWEKFSVYIGYTDKEPIWMPEGRTGEELKKLQKYAVRKFYLRPQQIIPRLLNLKFYQIKYYFTILKSLFFHKKRKIKLKDD